MTEMVFIVKAEPTGAYVARASGHSIFTEAISKEELAGSIREAVECHFEPVERPKYIRLHYVYEEVITL